MTSRTLRQVANQLRAGRHPLVAGSVGDLVLLQDLPLTLNDALERLACASFDVVLRLNAVDGIIVVKGQEGYDRSTREEPACGGESGAVELPERERRVQDLRRLTSGAVQDDPVVAIRRCLTQDKVSVAVVVDQADIILQDPAHHDQPDRVRVAGLQLALREAAHVGPYRNCCLMVAAESSGIPSVLLAGCEDVGHVQLTCPTADERAAYLRTVLPSMYGAEGLSDEARAALVGELTLLTDGDSLRSLNSLAAFSARGKQPVLLPKELVNLHRFGDRPDYWSHLRTRLGESHTTLLRTIYGQPAAVAAAIGTLASAAMGFDVSANPLGHEGRPRGILVLDGPTGTGKTELAKAIATLVFGDEEALTRLDMSTFSEPHSADRLTGTAPGYVGFEQGGELTNAVLERPNSVLLLDEIDKAHPNVLDRFLSILDDGRVTDGHGRVAYFSETLIIATGNISASAVAALLEQSDGAAGYDEVRAVAMAAVRRHFETLKRPELFNRLEAGIVIFDALRPDAIDHITLKIVGAATFHHGPRLDVDATSACRYARELMADPQHLALGGRQIRNIFIRRFRELAAWLAVNGHAEASEVRVSFEYEGILASVDGAAPVSIGVTPGSTQYMTPSQKDNSQ